MSNDGLDTRDLKRRLESKLFGDSALAVPTLGRFTIIGRLGQGGMGTVFAAYDPHLDRKVALKVLRGGGEANPDRQARMLREAQALAKLSHPNVVSIHEVGTVDGEIFMALEYVSGGSLADVETSAFDTLLEWLVQAGEGLEAAHQQGLVHRDVKPSNILVTGDGRAKVSDFGLATDPRQGQLETTFDGSSASSSGLSTQLERAGVLKTETGALVGTPAFMAPEQLDGATVDAKTDQFAFCVTAYRVLEGRPPFPGPTVAALRESITRGPQPVKHMPGWLERIVARGLSEDPAQRHASMRELVDAIERGRRPRDWKRSAFALGIVGTLGVAWALSSDGEATDPCDAFDDALADVWNDAARAKGREAFEATSQPYAAAAWVRTADSVEGYVAAWTHGARSSCEQTFREGVQSDEAHDLRMGCLQRARVDLEALVAILDDADAGVVSHAESLVLGLPDLRACDRVEDLRAVGLPPDDPNAAVAQEHIAHARSAIAAGRMEEAHAAATEALEAAEAAQWSAARAEALLALGKSGQELGKLEEAEAQLRLAIDVAESNRVDQIGAEAWIELLSNVVDFQTRPEPLDALSRRAEAAVHRIGDPPKLEVRRLTTLGRAKEVAGDYPGALEALRSAMALVEANDELPTLTRILAMHQLASTLSVMGEPDEAVAIRTEALELAKAELGDRHPTVAKLLSSLAVDYMDVPDDERALELFNESIALRDSLGIPAAAPYGNRGQLLVNMGRPREALPDFERAIALFSSTVGPDHPTIGAFKLQEATAYLTLGENDVGVKLLEEADALLAKQLPPEHPHRLAATINLATVLIEQGKSAEALAKAEGARRAMLEQSQPCSQPVMSTSTVIAGALLEVGRPADALAELDAIEACWETRPPDAVTSQADLKFNQARALKALGRTEEARTHALESRKLHEDLGPNYADQVVQIDAWLETL